MANISATAPPASHEELHRLLNPGGRIAELLGGSWRRNPPQSSPNEDQLRPLLSLLMRGNSAGLAWWKLRSSLAATSPAAQELVQAFRLYTVRAALHEREIATAARFLDERGIRSVLAKGWAIARLYPEKGMRPYGDIDLCVAPEDYEKTANALSSDSAPVAPVDLHRLFREIKERPFANLYSRSMAVQLGGVELRVLSAEDHLRLLTIHMLRHGVWKPVWLCDIALMIETVAAQLDWEYCLRGDTRRTDWMICAFVLARDLLGADLSKAPESVQARKLPGWLIPAVLHQWERGSYMQEERLSAYLKNPAQLTRALRLRWPNPIQATVNMEGKFSESPRLGYQIAECVRRAVRFGSSLLRR